MAVNPQKLLPPAKLSTSERMAAAYDKKIDDLLNLKIKKKLINVEKITNITKKTKQETKKKKKIREENETRKKKEQKQEEKQPTETTKIQLPSLPKTGLLDSVQNFLSYTFLGYMFTNYSDKMSPLAQVVKILPPALNTFGTIIKGTVDVAGGVIEGGYKFKDDLSKKIKEVGGEDAQKTYNSFTNNFKDMINRIMTLGIYQPPPIPQKVNGGLVTKMATGGVTRENRPVGGPVSRQVQPVKTKKQPVVFKQQTQPGRDIGGSKKIERIFPKSTNIQKPGPLNSLMTTSSELKKVPFIGSLMSAAVDIAMGQKPDRRVYQSFGQAISQLIGPTVESQSNASISNLTSAILRMASGGPVPLNRQISSTTSNTDRLATEIAKVFQISIENRLSKIFSEILKTKSASSVIEEQQGEYGDIEYGPLPLGMTEKQAFATIYELAKKNNAAMPELVAGMAMHESGYLGSPLARQYNNPFGQTGKGPKGSVKIIGNDGKERTFAVYNSLDEAVKEHVNSWNNNSKYGKGLGTYGSAVEGLKAGLPSYAPTSDGNNHANYIRSVSSILSTMGFNPQKKNAKVDLSSQQLIQKRRPAPGGTITGSAKSPNVLSSNETVVVEGSFRLRPDAAKAYLDMKRAAASDGISISLESAWRDSAKQAQLYKAYVEGRGNYAAAPGTSKHEKGIAIDLRNGISWAQRNGSRFGWINTGASFPQPEPWHFEFSENRYTPSLQTKTGKSLASAASSTPPAQVASTKPKIMNAADQVAMMPSYDQPETILILQEKIILKESDGSNNTEYSTPSSIAFPGVNSTMPTLIG